VVDQSKTNCGHSGEVDSGEVASVKGEGGGGEMDGGGGENK